MLRQLIRLFYCITALSPALIFSGCSSIYFFPTRNYVATPESFGLNYESVRLPVGRDGAVDLSAWWIPAQTQDSAAPACGTVVLFHGNAQNMGNHLFGSAWLPLAGFNLLIFDYRGYGSSSGQPNVPSLIADGAKVLDYALDRLDMSGLKQSKILIYGQSIGGALAIPVIANYNRRERIAGAVIESSFYSYPGIVREKLGAFLLTWPLQHPLSWLFLSRHNPKSFIGQIAPIPVLLVHGQNDEIVFPENSRELFKSANEPKELWEIPGGGHIDAFQHPEQRNRFTAYLQRLFGCTGNVAQTIK